MGRILGVDFGDARTGIAVSDESQFLAGGIGYIKSTYIVNTAKEIVKSAHENKVELIVVGNPINMNGTIGARSEKASELKRLIEEQCEIPVVLFDERCTTMSAHIYLNETNIKSKKRKEVIDTLSAQIILQNYLDMRKNKKNFI